MTLKILSKNLKQLRKMLGFNQAEFAKYLNITNGYVSDVERGKSDISKPILSLIEINFRVNLKWLLNDKGEPFVKEWIENKDFLFEGKGGPIREHTQDLGVWVGTRYADDDPRNPKNKTSNETIYNIDSNESEVHSPDAAYCPDPWYDILKKARDILESKSDYSSSLIAHIESSHNVLELDSRTKLLEEKCDKILNELTKIKKQLSTVGREKEENSAVLKTGG